MMDFWPKFPVFLLNWVPALVVKIPTALLGLVMVAILYRYRHEPFDEVPKIFTPWKNPEDWNGRYHGGPESLPPWWVKRRGGASFWDWYKYHAIRNPANGLRNFRVFVADVTDKDRIHWRAFPEYRENWDLGTAEREHPDVRTYGYVAWTGWKMGVLLIHRWNKERHFELKIGFRVKPSDAVHPKPDTHPRMNIGAGFASKFIPYRESD